MIAERPDWCISRQRFWGVPLIIFYCERVRGSSLTISRRCARVLKFFETRARTPGSRTRRKSCCRRARRCAKCGAANWRKETDILDVWFDSGSSHLAVLDRRDAQRRTAVARGHVSRRAGPVSRLVPQFAADRRRRCAARAPYRHVLTHGWTLDEKGRPMSKSLGNVVLPTEICEKWGADLLRLWVASQDYTADVRMSDNVMTQLSEAYRKIAQHVSLRARQSRGFRSGARRCARRARWKSSTAGCCRARRSWCGSAAKWYEGFEFHRVFHALHDFCGGGSERVLFRRAEGSAVHVCAAQPRAAFGANGDVSHRQRAAAPGRRRSLVFTCEEIWRYFPHDGERSGKRAPGAVSRRRRSWAAAVDARGEGELGEAADGCGERCWWRWKRRAPARRFPARWRRRCMLNGAHARAGAVEEICEVAAGVVHRLAGADVAEGDGGCGGGEARLRIRARARRRGEVRAVLELLHARGRERRIPDGLRTLRGRAERDRAHHRLATCCAACCV